MNRIIALILTFAFVVTLFSCGSNTGDRAQDQSTSFQDTEITTDSEGETMYNGSILDRALILSELSSVFSRRLDAKIGHNDDIHSNKDETLTRGEWLESNIPFIETPDALLDKIYYFRWDNLLSNLAKRKSDGKYEFTEGGPDTSYHKYIDCAQGAHLRDARWIKDTTYLNDYIDVTPRSESYWNYLIDSVLEKYYLDGDIEVIERNYAKLKARFASRSSKFDYDMGLYYLENGTEGQEAGVNGFDRLERGMTYTASYSAEGTTTDCLHDNITDGAYWSNEGSQNETDFIEIDIGTDLSKPLELRVWFKGEKPALSGIVITDGDTVKDARNVKITKNGDMTSITFAHTTGRKIRIEFEGAVSIYELVAVYTVEPGMTDSWWALIGGDQSYRICANSYMAAAADALSEMAALLGKDDDAEMFAKKSEDIVNAMLENVWDESESFFFELTQANKVRIIGKESNNYAPWAFGLMPDTEEYADAWKYLMDEDVFLATYGITTLEKGNPHYMQTFNHACLWNGPVWPHTFSLILTAMAEHLRSDSVSHVDADDYYDLLIRYCNCHFDSYSETKLAIREDHDPEENKWIAKSPEYNHSTFIDNVLNGLIGIRPMEDGLEIDPIVPEEWEYFCVENVTWQGHDLTVIYDKTGEKYGIGAGYKVILDGKLIFENETITTFKINIE